MAWPTPQDYNEAIQNPRLCFADPELQRGAPVLSPLGLPQVISGAFASVYQMQCPGRKYAVRCFTHYHPDQEKRYDIISMYLHKTRLPSMVDFVFLKEGIKIRGQWYPILKMEWVEGETLDTYVEKNLRNPHILQRLAERFLEITLGLRRHAIAHADLQHGNVLVVCGDLRLIDYDGMYVPGLEGMASHELGHRNYQHPGRTARDFAPYLDTFSVWVIYLSLLALSVEPHLWAQVRGGDEKLLLSREDFEHPEASRAFLILRRVSDPKIQSLSAVFETFIHCDLSQIPPLDTTPMAHETSTQATAAQRSDWLTDYVHFGTSATTENPRRSSSSRDASWIVDHLEPLSAVRTDVTLRPERLSLAASATLGGLLAYTVASGMILPVMATATIGGGFSLLLLLYTWRFRRIPAVAQRETVARKRHTLQREVQRREESVNKTLLRRNKFDQHAKQKYDEIQQQQHDCAQREQQEMHRIDRELTTMLSNLDAQRRSVDQTTTNDLEVLKRKLQKSLTDISQQRQRLNKEETDEIIQAQQGLQKQSLTSHLANYALDHASIPGVGSELKKRLADKGIKTAADVADIHITTSTGYGRHVHEIAYIEVPGRGRVHVEGIGPKKAAALLSWRQHIASRLPVAPSQSLPGERANRIRVKYQDRHRILELQEADMKREAESNEARVRSKHHIDCQSLERQRTDANEAARKKKDAVRVMYRQERESLEKKSRVVQESLTKEREELDKRVREEKKSLSEKQWELAKMQREMAAYQQVSFRSYLKRILSLRKLP